MSAWAAAVRQGADIASSRLEGSRKRSQSQRPTDGRLNLVQPHPVQLLTTVYPALVADLVVDGQRSIGVLVSRKHRGSEITSWLRHAVLVTIRCVLVGRSQVTRTARVHTTGSTCVFVLGRILNPCIYIYRIP